MIFVHEGAGELETTFGTLAYREHDYIVIPRGTTVSLPVRTATSCG